MTNQRKLIPAFKRSQFLDWVVKKGYKVGGSTRASEAFRVINEKKGEILIAHFDLNDPKMMSTTGRLSRLVSEWEASHSIAAGDVLK